MPRMSRFIIYVGFAETNLTLMKSILVIIISLLFPFIIIAQATNTRSGNWSDYTLWNKYLVPNGMDTVVLNYDIIIDENAACKFLNTNGHNVTVNTGIAFSIGKTVPATDTATLLSITTYALFNGVLNDTLRRVIRNSYVNGLRRIVIMETDGTADTSYNVFNYNNLNQLTSIFDYSNNPASGVYATTIIRSNNRIVKIIDDFNGNIEDLDSLSYTANGPNTDVQVYGLFPRTDTTYDGSGGITYISTSKNIVTVSPAFVPIEKRLYGYTFFGPPSLQKKYDTTRTIYSYDSKGNMSGFTETFSGTFTNSTAVPSIYKDTAIWSFLRNTPDSASLYKVLRDIYGNDLLTLMDCGQVTLEIRDVTGYVYPPYGQFEYHQQTLKSIIYSKIQYLNGNVYADDGPRQIYRADNVFDNRQRLTRSVIDDGTAYFTINMSIAYP